MQGSMLQCIVCRQTLASLVELQMHGKHHFQMRPSFYTCCVCLKTFDSKENLVSKLNSSGRTYYVCKPCYHGESPLYTCPQCSDKFASRAQLEAHAATHAPSSTVTSALSTAAAPGTAPQTFQCIKCQESFSTEYEIQLHVANHMLQEGTTHECKLCSKLFDSPARLQCHLIEHSFKKGAELHCGICRQVFATPAKIQAHALEHGVQGRRHACSQCNQQFFFSAELENHMLIYGHCAGSVSSDSSSSRYECRECSKMFASATALANHRKTHERRDTNVKCSLCIQTFSSVAKMQEHFLLAHTVDETESSPGKIKSRGYCCPHCKQQFASVESVQAHVKTHRTGGNKLSCPVCSKTFSQARNLTLHLRSHAGDKPYQCNVCQKRFSREENLRAHCKSHTSLSNLLVCPLCDRSFILKSEITEHLKTHFTATEEKSHQIQHTLKDLEAPIETVWNNGSDSLKSPEENRKADDAKVMPEINGSQSNSSSEPKASDQTFCETSQSLQIKTELVA
ncbi:hypothetical protein C0Q70_19213 [Pomacea canaliculata]|uniref:C2H2-type domain-containing protein n=1 Tax=Pomacea canaliculata TaxID=400727 RepID=A0A2T7NIP5_POMCA|nr:hypothetical protein C0Q70_19213 [Pomacea canaliculata]